MRIEGHTKQMRFVCLLKDAVGLTYYMCPHTTTIVRIEGHTKQMRFVCLLKEAVGLTYYVSVDYYE